MRTFDLHRHLPLSPADQALFRVPARTQHADWIAATVERRGQGDARTALHPPSYYVLTDGIEATRRLNDLVHTTVQGHGGGAVAIGTVEPHHGDASLAEIDRMADELGFAGIVWRPRAQGVFADSPMMSTFIARASERGLVPMVHASPGSGNEALWRVWRLAERFPSIPIVVLGALSEWDQQQAVLAEPDRARNIVYELSGFFGEPEEIGGFAERIGIERLVFGSGAFCDGPLDGDRAASVIADSDLAAASTQAVLWDNAARLFDRDGPRS